MSETTLDELEIINIFRCLFDTDPDIEFCQYYKKISSHVIISYPQSQIDIVKKILSKNTLKIKLYEYCLRRNESKHLLCILFKLMIHAGETRPNVRKYLITNENNNSQIKSVLILLKEISSFLLIVLPFYVFTRCKYER